MGKEGSYGYKNEQGVYIKAQEDKKVETHIGIYDRRPDDPDHVSIHINVDTDNKTYTANDNTSGSNEPSSGGCFLTTACMKHMRENFDDKCYELELLRWFRDNFVSEDDIKHYYTLAPIIVEELDKLEGCDDIYQRIYDEVIKVCVKQIQNDDYKSAYELYKKCIFELEEKYAGPILGQRLISVLKKKRDLMQIREGHNFSYDQENIDYIRNSLNEKDGMPEKVYRMVFSSRSCDVKINGNSRKICAESLLK